MAISTGSGPTRDTMHVSLDYEPLVYFELTFVALLKKRLDKAPSLRIDNPIPIPINHKLVDRLVSRNGYVHFNFTGCNGGVAGNTSQPCQMYAFHGKRFVRDVRMTRSAVFRLLVYIVHSVALFALAFLACRECCC